MKVLLISLGCDKNRVDSEVMLGILAAHGFTFTDEIEEAEAAVVNSCCFIGDAKEESIQNIMDLALLRTSGQLKALIVTGCLAQRYRKELLEEVPEIDRLLGTTGVEHIAQALEEVLAETGSKTDFEEPLDLPVIGNRPRVRTTGGSHSYLKIAEGCDRNCTYCIIPKVRGHYRSVPMEQLVAEAEKLVAEGIRELILVAQETTLYGTDLYGEKKLPELLRRLCAIEDLKWIRLLYCYPEEIDQPLIDVMKEQPKIVHYLDIPIQSGSDRILKKMGRRTNHAEICEKIAHLREEIPDICIRTTLISGFPSETAADQKQTMELLEECRFDRLGVFTYSQEEDTKAYEMPNQVPEPLKKRRQNQIMKRQQKFAFESAEAMIGTSMDVVIEGRLVDDDDSDEEGYTYVARSFRDAPGIDGYVFIHGVTRDLISGDFVRVKIEASHEYDLIGGIEDEFTE